MKKVLVIGNTSKLGKRLASRLARAYEIYTAGRNSEADVFLDLATGKCELPPVPEINVILHCASSFGDNSLEGATKNEIINGVGVYHVARLARNTGCTHLIYISTIFAYRHPENDYFFSYGLSKAHGEENLKIYCETGGITVYVSDRPLLDIAHDKLLFYHWLQRQGREGN